VALGSKPIWSGLVIALIGMVILAMPVSAAPTFPPLTGRVVDNANLLSAEGTQALSAKLEALEAATGHQVVVVTLPTLQGYEIEDYGYQLGRTWQIGQKGEDDGALLIIAPTERKVRIEVGYGLEGVMTDALSNVIIQQKVLPPFKAGDMEAGIIGGTDAIIAQLSASPEEAAATLKAVSKPSRPSKSQIDPGALIMMIFVLFWVMGGVFGRRRGGLGALLPWIILSGSLGGGRSGNDGFGGGGFGGGGGSFGGGGSSGSW
jgi:uncharacterized protein